MIEYLALEEKSTSELTCEVNRLIKEGWHPVGGIAVAVTFLSTTFNQAAFSFHQALIRPIPEEETSAKLHYS
jgi:hypothetical protein